MGPFSVDFPPCSASPTPLLIYQDDRKTVLPAELQSVVQMYHRFNQAMPHIVRASAVEAAAECLG